MHRATVLVLLFGCPTFADEIRIATWNVREVFKKSDVTSRCVDFQRASSGLRPDILLLQEVTSFGEAKAIRDCMGLDGYHVQCSNFVKDSNNHSAFEVAIVSRFPLTYVEEHDPSAEGRRSARHDPHEVPLVTATGVDTANTSRGFLVADILDLELTVAVVHLKSSRGQVGESDASNAKKREFVIGAVARLFAQYKRDFPEYTYLVAGDFNVGHSDAKKLGKDLGEECFKNCGASDLYDETHALLAEGLVEGLRMKNLAASVTNSTFPAYPGSPIDNIYVVGPATGQFGDASVGTETFGSDHLPVFVVLQR